jgi:outer membrane protein assembly factor BamB
VKRGLVLSLFFVTLAAGCALAPRVRGPERQKAVATPARKVPTAKEHSKNVLVTVVDGDTDRRVRGARVSIGRRVATTDTRGVARVPLYQRAAVAVTVEKRGYLARTVRLWFRQRPQSSLRVYQRRLQWPAYGVTPTRTQAQSEIRLRPPFKLAWSRDIGGLIEFPAVVWQGVAYIGNYHGTIYAVELRGGKVVWRYDPLGGKMASSPAVFGPDLVVHGMDGVVRVLDRRTGRLRWRFATGSPIESSPVIAGSVDYFGAWNGRIYALDLRRHKLRWTIRPGYKITSSAALAGGTLFIGDYGGRLLALSQRTGRLRWSRSVNGRIYGTPAVAAGRVFVPSSDGDSLTAFSTGGRYLWRRNTGAYVYSSPAVWGGRVVFGSYNGLLYCVSARSGRTLWAVGAGGPVSGAAVVVDAVAYGGSTGGRITGVDIRSGRVLLRFPHGEYVPVSGSGGTLLLHGYSRLYSVRPR